MQVEYNPFQRFTSWTGTRASEAQWPLLYRLVVIAILALTCWGIVIGAVVGIAMALE